MGEALRVVATTGREARRSTRVARLDRASAGRRPRRAARPFRTLALVLLSSGLLVSGPLLAASAARADGELVEVSRYRLTPSLARIHPGQTVTFVADEEDSLVDSMLPVTIVFEGRLRSPPLEPGDEWRLRFERTGIYPFHVDEHRDVEGSVVVE